MLDITLFLAFSGSALKKKNSLLSNVFVTKNTFFPTSTIILKTECACLKPYSFSLSIFCAAFFPLSRNSFLSTIQLIQHKKTKSVFSLIIINVKGRVLIGKVLIDKIVAPARSAFAGRSGA